MVTEVLQLRGVVRPRPAVRRSESSPTPGGRALRLLTMLSAAILAGSPSSSAAESVAVVGVGSCGDPTLASQVREVRAALRRRLGAAVQSEAEMLSTLGGAPRGSLAGASQLLEEAEAEIGSEDRGSSAEYEKRDHRVQEKFRQASEVLSSLPPSPERSQALRALITLELQVFSGTGRRAELERTLRSIFRVLPTFAFDAKVFSAPQLQEFERVRRATAGTATAELRVTGAPPGRPVYVDGLEVGPAPFSMRLPAGVYRVESAGAPRRGIAHEVRISEGTPSEITIDAAFEDAVEPGGGPCVVADGPRERAGKLASLARLLGVETVVGVRAEHGPSGSHLVLEALDAERGLRARGAAIKLENGRPAQAGMDRAWDVLSSKTPIQLLPSESLFLASFSSPPPPAPWIRPTAYATGAAALGLLGFSLYEALSCKRSYDKAATYILPGGRGLSNEAAYDQALRDGDAAAKAGYIGAGGAAVATGAAAVLWLLSREPQPAVIRF